MEHYGQRVSIKFPPHSEVCCLSLRLQEHVMNGGANTGSSYCKLNTLPLRYPIISFSPTDHDVRPIRVFGYFLVYLTEY